MLPPRAAPALPEADCLAGCVMAALLMLLDCTGLSLADDAKDDDAPVRLLCTAVPRPLLLELPMPPRVDTLLVKTLSEPVMLRLPCHLLSLMTIVPPG